LPVDPDQLEREVAGYAYAIESGAALPALRDQAADLFDKLVRPLLRALDGHSSVVLVPDTFLQSLSFASLWNRQAGRYLVEDYRLGHAPNGTVFVRASARASRARSTESPRVLAIGNPRLDPSLGLEDLRGSEREAEEIAQLYRESELLVGGAASKGAFLDGLRRSGVVHFAGHTTQGDGPGSGRLLFSGDPNVPSSSVLSPAEISPADVAQTRLVVLAGCRTATSARSRLEGAIGTVRPFLAAGVPMVVASLWDVDDSTSRSFFREFHRRFPANNDAAAALREVQIAFLHGDDPVLAHPSSWAGYMSFGGMLTPRQANRRKAEPSL
jgi:CHAT domain-containing protein